ncbi:unnamed protein product [Cyclocybe aegerita]|uniref:Peptidase C14 caspase domain-containing protein n=1 Tax=Cyclocybe aegerita TaxID=1973307 RepID=A0A8S0XFW5_CYCAE|nr:unnamed protein product [Cyclocybe aegerita]
MLTCARMMESEADGRLLTVSPPPSLTPSGKRKALLIGIRGPLAVSQDVGSSEPPFRLKGPHEEARAMGNLLHLRYSYALDDITYLLDEEGYEQPTKENILEHICLLVQDAQPGDRFFFYYSGHSDQQETNDPSEEDGMGEFIITCDPQEEHILDNVLHTALVEPLPPGARLTAIFDSCHSGTLLDLPHYRCNAVHFPSVNKGRRGTLARWRAQERRNALFFDDSDLSDDSSMALSRRRTTALSRPSLAIRTDAMWSGHHECDSPVPQNRYCDGYTCMAWEENLGPVPTVISFSSSADNQETWEDETGRSMTGILVKMLQKDPHPSLHGILSTVSLLDFSLGLHEIYIQRHRDAVEYREELRRFNDSRIRKNKPPFVPGFLPEMSNFQTPQLSSLRPIAPDAKWDP